MPTVLSAEDECIDRLDLQRVIAQLTLSEKNAVLKKYREEPMNGAERKALTSARKKFKELW